MTSKNEKHEWLLQRTLREFQTVLVKKTPESFREKHGTKRLKLLSLEIANLLTHLTNNDKLPIDLEPIRKKRLIHEITLQHTPSLVETELVPDDQGFTIKIADEKNIRTRIAIAHEIGHTLFFDTDKLPPKKLTINRSPWSKYDKEEWISWDFARELLLPQRLVFPELDKVGLPSPKTLMGLAKKWMVSIDVLCHRLIWDLNFWDNCIITLFNIEKINSRLDTRVFKGKRVTQFNVLGKRGLVENSDEFNELVNYLKQHGKIEESIHWKNHNFWIQLLQYSRRHAIGIIEVPKYYEFTSA